ncbi:hypothetical protein M3Y99_00230800 [Aphelenchoides fujianensis]|nr:hypothetical protein M3Y99_00237000 [Aphelenchoides fujianensis]KAI6242449.1 hypothetical protein M3Y99_00230800 [Aphelenchoides fujianensis]
MGVAALKLGLLLAMVLLTVFAGLLPIWLLKLLRKKAATAQSARQKKYASLVLCLLTCFSGGVFLATCFLHLFPELAEHLAHMREEYKLDIDYPVAELLSCAGFFLLFFLEEAVLYLIPSMAHGHSHGGGGHSHDLDDLFAGDHSCRGQNSHCGQHDHGANNPTCRLLSHSGADEEQHADEHANNHAHNHEARHRAGAEVTIATVTTAACTSPNVTEPKDVLAAKAPASSTVKFTTSCTRTECAVALAEPERCETNCERVKEDPPILMKSRPHAHSHSTRSVTIVLAIAFHAIIEGLAMGVQQDPPKVWAIFISLTVHKLIVAFSVGLQLARTHAHALRWVVISMVLISLMTPLGGVLGMLVQNAPMSARLRDYLVLVCQGIAVGTFIYVTFFEVLIHERDNEHPNLLKLLMMLLGFAMIGLIRLLVEGHDHSHGHSHGHSHVHDGFSANP